jgi:hypothetical protein
MHLGTGKLKILRRDGMAYLKNEVRSILESREYLRKDPSRWPHDTLYPQKFALTSPTRGGRSVGIVRSQTRATELFLLVGFIT